MLDPLLVEVVVVPEVVVPDELVLGSLVLGSLVLVTPPEVFVLPSLASLVLGIAVDAALVDPPLVSVVVAADSRHEGSCWVFKKPSSTQGTAHPASATTPTTEGKPHDAPNPATSAAPILSQVRPRGTTRAMRPRVDIPWRRTTSSAGGCAAPARHAGPACSPLALSRRRS